MATLSNITSENLVQERVGGGVQSPQIHSPVLMNMGRISCVIYRLTFSEWISLVVRVSYGKCKVNIFCMWIESPFRAKWYQTFTRCVWGGRQGEVGRCGQEKLHWNSPFTFLLIVKDFLAFSYGNFRHRWKYFKTYNTHGPATWISIFLTGVNTGKCCIILWMLAKIQGENFILCSGF